MQNEDFKKVLTEIGNKAKVKFAYNENAVRKVKGITLNCTNETLQLVFEKINQQQNFKYEVSKIQI